MHIIESAPAYTHQFWAKSEPRDGHPKRIHLLEHHLADVGACFQALLAQRTIRQRLAQSGGLEDLDETNVARLCVFAALHDIGKVNVGFQVRIWRPEDLPAGERRPRHAGHTTDLGPVLTGEDGRTAEWFFDALGWWHDATESWDDREGETVCALLIAALSHHGRPLQLQGGRSENPAIWRPFGGLRPEDHVHRIGALVRGWFPAAFATGAPLLPSAPAFQHMFLGLCNWADWIGSDERHFRYCDQPLENYFREAQRRAETAIREIGLDLAGQRNTFAGAPGFGALFPDVGATPNAIQRAAHDTPLDQPLVIIESETGSGKTEAALWRFARMYETGLVDGLYFALPTRAAAKQIHERVKHCIRSLFSVGCPAVVLAVSGYEPGGSDGGAALPRYDPWWEAGGGADRSWATENPKRYLAAQVAVGTVDQAMMGALQVKNAHMRAACLARNLLVVDEVHASDAYMSVVLEALLDTHVGAGGYALLMSATLGSAARQRWLHHGQRAADNPIPLQEAVDAPYPAISTPSGLTGAGENDREKVVCIEAAPEMHDFADTARRALEAARDGARVLVVRNTVGHAVRTQQALEELAEYDDAGLLFQVEGVPTLHHGRFAACDRALLDGRIQELLGKDRRRPGGLVVVGTQTLEQSLDIDGDLLITDLCPVDVLLQRIGRLHRHGGNPRPGRYANPACIVLTPPDNDLNPLLERGPAPNGLGPHGGVYRSLSTLEATRRLISERPQWRIPKMNRALVEHATHPDALKAIAAEMGDAWQAHAVNTEGGEIADKQLARDHTIKRDKAFFEDNREVCFVSDEKRVRTRLGDDRVDVVLDPHQPSPFDASKRIDRLAVSVRWLGSAEVPDAVEPTSVDVGFTFNVGDRRFMYDRLGLRRV